MNAKEPTHIGIDGAQPSVNADQTTRAVDPHASHALGVDVPDQRGTWPARFGRHSLSPASFTLTAGSAKCTWRTISNSAGPSR